MADYDFMQQLSDKYYNSLYQYVNKICFNKSIVFDIVQDTLMTAYQKADELQYHENLSGWLHLTAKHRMLQLLTECLNYDHLESIEDLSDGRNYEDECIAIADLYPIMAEYLTPDELQLILQHYKEGYDFYELAEIHHTTKSSIKMKIARAKKKLRSAIHKKYI